MVGAAGVGIALGLRRDCVGTANGTALALPTAVLHGCCVCIAVVLYCYRTGPVQVLHWHSLGTDLVRYWCYIGSALVLYWYRTGVVLRLYPYWSDIVLALRCHCAGSMYNTCAVLVRRWCCTGTAHAVRL